MEYVLYLLGIRNWAHRKILSSYDINHYTKFINQAVLGRDPKFTEVSVYQ